MFERIMVYIDHIVDLVRPKKLLYLAIDGVAPRAKMNQQRERRFRTAQAKHVTLSDVDMIKESFDTNSITPGTIFMLQLSEHLQYYVSKRCIENPLWKNLQVIYSSSQICGEGEHKIIEYIRTMKMQTDYNLDMSHCIYGLDADLIILSLLSHEKYISLQREEVIFGKQSTIDRKLVLRPQDFQLLHIGILREYLSIDFNTKDKLFDVERIIDDLIQLTFFIGNDFLPGFYVTNIIDDGMNILIDTYREILPTLPSYITNYGTINMSSLQIFLKNLASKENDLFASCYSNYIKRKTRWIKNENNETKSSSITDGIANLSINTHNPSPNTIESNSNSNNEQIIIREKRINVGISPKLSSDNYYKLRFKANEKEYQTIDELRKNICKKYLEGQFWCHKYYYFGIVSWNWYYPYHDAPQIYDLANFIPESLELTYSKPFTPYQQLLAVLPPSSYQSLPSIYQKLLSDINSPIADFYPREYIIDMDYKVAPWEGTIHIPLIDDKRLFDEFSKIDENLLTVLQYKYRKNFDLPFIIVNKKSKNKELLNYSKDLHNEYITSIDYTDIQLFPPLDNLDTIIIRSFSLPKIPPLISSNIDDTSSGTNTANDAVNTDTNNSAVNTGTTNNAVNTDTINDAVNADINNNDNSTRDKNYIKNKIEDIEKAYKDEEIYFKIPPEIKTTNRYIPCIKSNTNYLSSYPTLNILPNKLYYKKQSLTIFNTKSKFLGSICSIQAYPYIHENTTNNIYSIAELFFKTNMEYPYILYNYPFFNIGIINKIETVSSIAYMKDKAIIIKQNTNSNYTSQIIDEYKDTLLNTRGIYINDLYDKYLLYIQPLDNYKVQSDGSTRYIIDTSIPLCTTLLPLCIPLYMLLNNKFLDKRQLPKSSLPINELFPINSYIYSIGSNKHGWIGNIINKYKDNIEITFLEPLYLPNTLEIKKIIRNNSIEYMPQKNIISDQPLDLYNIIKLLSNFTIKGTIDIGLRVLLPHIDYMIHDIIRPKNFWYRYTINDYKDILYNSLNPRTIPLYDLEISKKGYELLNNYINILYSIFGPKFPKIQSKLSTNTIASSLLKDIQLNFNELKCVASPCTTICLSYTICKEIELYIQSVERKRLALWEYNNSVIIDKDVINQNDIIVYVIYDSIGRYEGITCLNKNNNTIYYISLNLKRYNKDLINKQMFNTDDSIKQDTNYDKLLFEIIDITNISTKDTIKKNNNLYHKHTKTISSNDTTIISTNLGQPYIPKKYELNNYKNTSNNINDKTPKLLTNLNLGDRIICIDILCNVPFGLHGTVVSIEPILGNIEIIFDQAFVGGTFLYGKLRTPRGYTLHFTQILLYNTFSNKNRLNKGFTATTKLNKEYNTSNIITTNKNQINKRFYNNNNNNKKLDIKTSIDQ